MATLALAPERAAATAGAAQWLCTSPPKSKKPVAPPAADRARKRLRVADPRVEALLNPRTPSAAFVAACEALAHEDEIVLLARTEPLAWSLALRRRLRQGDASGARALLDFLAGFARENTTEQLWTDLLFAVLRQPRSSIGGGPSTLFRMLEGLRTLYGADFVAAVVVATANGCANAGVFDGARLLVRYHLEHLQAPGVDAVPVPPSIVGNLASAMAEATKFADVVEFVQHELLAHERFNVTSDFQQQGFLALFRSYTETGSLPDAGVNQFLAFVRANATDEASTRSLMLEKGFGAAIQCCVAGDRPALALRCYDAVCRLNAGRDAEEEEELVPLDENMFVNVLKACAALHDGGLFRDVYCEMVARGVARSPGFGSAIRFCHVHRDARFLERVLADAFATEEALQGSWTLEIEQYNDALGCLAEAGEYEQARELFFSRLLANPFVVPDHITMVEMVQNYRRASLSEVFSLMEVFLQLGLSPNKQVYTSLLACCARQRLLGDARALLAAMEAHRVLPDVKTFTTVGFVYGAHGDVPALVALVQEMAARGLEADQQFFDYVLNALHDSSGIDVCFALFRDVCAADIAIPAGLYRALVALGTSLGLVERTLHVAYNMECDGVELSAAQLQALVSRAASEAEVTELARTFVLLHQGQLNPARFPAEVYDELLALLARFPSRRGAIAQVRALADAAAACRSDGHDFDYSHDDSEDLNGGDGVVNIHQV